MTHNKEVNEITRTVKELFIKAKNNQIELSILIDKYLIPSENEKKEAAEISTPYELRKNMLNKIPINFWTKPRKTFEPCSGKGGFLIDIVSKFMTGLTDMYPDKKERYRVVVEECLYFSDISAVNISINKLLLDPKNIYNINFNIGNTLTLNTKEKWGIEVFDAVIGNPPYQLKVGPKKTQPIWNLFFKMAINHVAKDGYLVFIHPSSWRSPDGVYKDIFNIIQEKKLIYLSMNDFKEGKRVFNCGTNFDYYILQNNNDEDECNTIVEDIDGNITKINLKKWDFIPSGSFNIFNKLISGSGERTEVLYSRSAYGTDKNNMSKNKNVQFKYPCCYTITTKNGLNLWYSDVKTVHFEIPKVIWSNGAPTPIVDTLGEYGLTQFSYAIADNPVDLLKIEKAMNTEKFIKLMTYVKFTDNKYNYKVIRLFKKDFWKEFNN